MKASRLRALLQTMPLPAITCGGLTCGGLVAPVLLAGLMLTGNVAANNGDDLYDGGPGIDTIDYSNARQPVSVDLEQQSASGHDIGNDTILNIENVIGGRGNDRIAGDAENNLLDGGPGGSDFIDGRQGFDTAVFRGPRSHYRIARPSPHEITVSDRNDTDTLVNIDALRFADGTVLVKDLSFE